MDLYAFPPSPLVGLVIACVRELSRVAMTLVAHLWPEKEWFADLLLLLTQPPLALPWWDSLLRQPHCNLFHQGVHKLNLHAWRLSSVTSESWAFREGLLESCQGVSDPPPHASTSRGGRSSVVGVVEGRCSSQRHCSSSRGLSNTVHLRHDKGLSVSAVKGYSSALNLVLALRGAISRHLGRLRCFFVASLDPWILSSFVLLLET